MEQVIVLRTLKKNILLSIFKNQNNISYNLFNLIYEALKTKPNLESTTISNFIKNGYSSSAKVKEDDIDLINQNLEKITKKYSNHVTNFEFNHNLKSIIKKIFINNFENEIKKFSDFYDSRIIVSHIRIFTNHGFNKKKNEDNQFFSEKYHTDNYYFTYFKLFVNLENIDEEKGPLHFVPKSRTKEFIKNYDYKNRYSYIENQNKDYIFQNIGQKGDSLFVNTTQCIHRAGIPEENQNRTILLFHLNAIPGRKNNTKYFEYENSSNDIFFSDYWSRYYAKPIKVFDNLKLLRNFLF